MWLDFTIQLNSCFCLRMKHSHFKKLRSSWPRLFSESKSSPWDFWIQDVEESVMCIFNGRRLSQTFLKSFHRVSGSRVFMYAFIASARVAEIAQVHKSLIACDLVHIQKLLFFWRYIFSRCQIHLLSRNTKTRKGGILHKTGYIARSGLVYSLISSTVP